MYLKRKIDNILMDFFDINQKKAILISGARQTGKTESIRNFGENNFDSFIEINFLKNNKAIGLFDDISSPEEILLRITAISSKPLIKGRTLIFFDEVQECKEITTAIKFLVEENNYKYILSGSLLGIELKDIRSIPVGYLEEVQMFPMDFQEFCQAIGLANNVWEAVESSYKEQKSVDKFIHDKMMEILRLYLMVGGMPAAVKRYIQTNNLRFVYEEQRGIINMYKKDISKYDPNNKLYIDETFNLIPAELNAKNKRFIFKELNQNFKFSRYENSFLWLNDAGVALPTYNADEPKIPLLLSKSRNLFKLFSNDVGLLAAQYGQDIQVKILKNELDINFGAIYENFVAQELKTHGYALYYFNNKKQGEVDFLIEESGNICPIEVKSGKDYKVHSALNNLISNRNYKISYSVVFNNNNLILEGTTHYYPIYFVSFFTNEHPKNLIYTIDLCRQSAGLPTRPSF